LLFPVVRFELASKPDAILDEPLVSFAREKAASPRLLSPVVLLRSAFVPVAGFRWPKPCHMR
jgi:hypothetical protein